LRSALIKIQVGNLQTPNFEAAKPTAIQQTDQHPVFEQFRRLEKSADFFLTQDNWELFDVLDGGKFDPLILHSLDSVGETKGINGKLEVGVRGRVMTSLDQMQVIVDPFGVHFGRQFIEVDRQFGQVTTVIGNSALTFASNGNFLLKLSEQFSKSCYIRISSLREVLFFS
jgi:hypothetical protein